jgi:chromosome segregation protein
LIIANLNAGVSLWRQNGFRGTFVTPEGDIINSQGILTGGTSSNGERGLLADKRQIGELKKDIMRLAKELATAEEERKKTTLSIVRCEEELLQAKTEWHQLELRINGRRKDQERFEDEIRRINQRSSILTFDLESLTSEEKEAREKMAGAKKAQILLAEREKIVNDELAELKVKLDVLKKELHQEEGAFSSANITLAARKGKWESDQKSIIRLEASKNALIRDLSEKQKDTKLSYDQIAELTKKVAGELEYLTGIYHDFQEREATLAAKSKHLQEQEERLKKVEMEVREIKQRLEQILKEKTELDISLREINFQMDNLKKRIVERHQLDLDSINNEFTCLTTDESRHISEKLEKLRDTVDNFGEVNLLALNEYEELKIRFDFLTSQNADINASLNSLQHTIERINRISKARFAETFAAVRNSFREMFARMFPGGKGELYLTDSEDMLETGVEIDIQVPGKRTRNISLLSGGEKSLAAIALIFAILHYRPTPFLVLDEVDAALDDANIFLFNNLIRDISNDSQIIIVTHNKKTMEAAQNLYGITMQIRGVSTLVSVSLN